MHIELARRAVACKHWRWMQGMLIASGKGNCRLSELDFGWIEEDDRDLLPDLDDPATVGCLLALVRHVYAEPAMTTCLAHNGLEWFVWRWSTDHGPVSTGPTEAAALVAALEAAP